MTDSAIEDWEQRSREMATSRILLIDGFNVLHAVLLGKDREAGWWRRDARERLLRRARNWPGIEDELWVAFDGAQPAWSVWAEPVAVPHSVQAAQTTLGARQPMLHSVYVESADDWIVRRARRSAEPARTIVVSADRKVAGRARSAGCEIWTPWSFMSRCPLEHEDKAVAPGTRTVQECPAHPHDSDPDGLDPNETDTGIPGEPRLR